ncbi:MAG: L-arabinose isomerase [Puniceicoccaceae bacterium]|nr:MAG: L-arabinose isomerase [Puniceicoccaceae bacterium]
MTASTPAPSIWFLTGSQHLYGEEAIRQVEANARAIVEGLNASGRLPLPVEAKPVLTTPDAIRSLVLEANADPACAGLVAWMHTFSPAKMWIGGLAALGKPLLHLHTQFNRDLPWSTIDMDFMNLNQAAHGDREFGFINTRMRRERKVVAGHWQSPEVHTAFAAWMRAARAWADWQGARFARFGDNMRQVAVTEGDKVAAGIRFGFAVDGYGVGDLVAACREISDTAVDALAREYEQTYATAKALRRGGDRHESLREAARIELGLQAFLTAGGFKGFTTTFEDLHGLPQLPGLAVQRLMAAGYGFGAEGDWKTCALLRAMKVMADGLPEGVSFMEDYTYHLEPGRESVLGAHMLEICPSIAAGQPSLEIHPLSIGGKADPVRLVFDSPPGEALNASLIDLGPRFRLLVNTVEAITPREPMPKLPVARALWKPHPDFATATACWIHAGGAHHTGYTRALSPEILEDFADIAGVEFVLIDRQSSVRTLRQELRWSDLYHHLAHGLGHS